MSLDDIIKLNKKSGNGREGGSSREAGRSSGRRPSRPVRDRRNNFQREGNNRYIPYTRVRKIYWNHKTLLEMINYFVVSYVRFFGDSADFLFWAGDNPFWTLNYLEQMFSLYFTTKLTKVNKHHQKLYTAWSQRVKMSLIQMDFFFQDGCCLPSAFYQVARWGALTGRKSPWRHFLITEMSQCICKCCCNVWAIFLQCKMNFDSDFRLSSSLNDDFSLLFSLTLGLLTMVWSTNLNADCVAFHSPVNYLTNGSMTCLRNTTMELRGAKQKEAPNS